MVYGIKLPIKQGASKTLVLRTCRVCILCRQHLFQRVFVCLPVGKIINLGAVAGRKLLHMIIFMVWYHTVLGMVLYWYRTTVTHKMLPNHVAVAVEVSGSDN